jgi:hypothetical protein
VANLSATPTWFRSLSELLEILIEPACEAEEIIALILEGAADRLQPVGAFPDTRLQLSHDKVIQL